MSHFHALSITPPDHDLESLLPMLHQHAAWGWEEQEPDTAVVHFSSLDQATAFKAAVERQLPGCTFALNQVSQADWSEEWKKFFQPVEISGTFIILPQWLQDQPSKLKKIIITPKMAFGTGHHPTTCLCLKALARMYGQGIIKKGQSFLDIGTGSGILGIGGAMLGLTGTGIDVDSQAADNARENLLLNQTEKVFQVRTGDLSVIQPAERFNLIMANILASPLKFMARDIIARLEAPFALVLSGILRDQARDVALVYQNLGLGEPEIMNQGEWSALVWIGDKTGS